MQLHGFFFSWRLKFYRYSAVKNEYRREYKKLLSSLRVSTITV